MKLLVYLRDGRTVYALRGRKELARLVGAEPWGEHEAVYVVRGIWNPVTGQFMWTPNIRVRFIARGSISSVEEGDPNDATEAGR